MHRHLTTLSLAALLLVACGPKFPANNVPRISDEGNVGAACNSPSDCMLPMSFAVRSMCAFTAVCANSRCTVACPMVDVQVTSYGADVHPVRCEQDSDCTCEYAANDMERCACVSGSCMAIVNAE